MTHKRGGRDGLVISTKYSLPLPLGNVNFCGNHRKNMFFALENSLKRLRTDYIDLYYGTLSFPLQEIDVSVCVDGHSTFLGSQYA